MNLHLKNCRVIDPGTGLDAMNDILIVDGVIEKMGKNLSSPEDTHRIDLTGKIVVPGFIDMHVHLREPGFEHKETIESGCRSAAAGGFTAVCCMPNTSPAIDEASVVTRIKEQASRVLSGLVDVYPVAAATKGREGKELSPMFELADAGAVAFSDDGAPIMSAEIMRRALEYAGMRNMPVIQHAEETTMTHGGSMNEGIVATSLGLQAMPAIAEDIMIARDIGIAEYVGAPYHVAHLSTAGAVELVRAAKKKKLPVTCEVTPHHFTLTDEAVRSFDTNLKMNPPLRTRSDVDAIREGLRDGTIDAIASDHAPHSSDEKQVEFAYAPFGSVGLETSVGICLTELVHANILTIYQLIEKMSVNPRSLLHLPAIAIKEGEPANMTILDLDAQWVVDTQRFESKSKNSPFHKMKLKGKAIGIINKNSTSLQI